MKTKTMLLMEIMSKQCQHPFGQEIYFQSTTQLEELPNAYPARKLLQD